jgi:hypothetical protein
MMHIILVQSYKFVYKLYIFYVLNVAAARKATDVPSVSKFIPHMGKHVGIYVWNSHGSEFFCGGQ